MANQRKNRLFASVRVDDDGTILARTPEIASVEDLGGGDFRVNFVEGIAAAEETHDLCSGGEDKDPIVPTTMTAERETDTSYLIHLSAASLWSFTVYRVGP